MVIPLRVLIVEDSEDDTLFLLRALERGGYDATYRRVETASEMRDALAFGSWEIVLADYTLPQFSGGNALALLRRSGLDLPFIIVSGSIGEDTAVAAMKAGAHDYILKTNLNRLLPAVERELRDAETRREKRKAEQRLAEHVIEIESLNARLADQQEELATFHDLVTHDVSNFSMALLGIVERLLTEVEGPLSPKQQHLLRRANRQGLVVNLLAENARMMARLRRRGLATERGPIRLAPALRRAAETLHAMHFDRVFQVTVDCPEDLDVMGVPFLEVAFLSLLDNAVRHGRDGQTLQLRVAASIAGDRVRLAFRSDGGLDEELRLSLLNRPATGRPTSSGLALSVAREVVETLGGRLETAAPADAPDSPLELVLSIPRS
jgi:signal transduction histidine kinase